MVTKGDRSCLLGDESVLQLTVVMVVQTCEHTKNSTMYFTWVNCVVCELYLKKKKNKNLLL